MKLKNKEVSVDDSRGTARNSAPAEQPENSSKTICKSSRKIYGVIVLILALVVVLLALGWHGLFGPKLQSYTFTNNEGDTYTVNYYRGSIQKQYAFIASVGDNSLVSSLQVQGGVPLALAAGGFPDDIKGAVDQSLQAINSGKNCTLIQGSKKAGSVLISSLNLSASICTVMNLYYYSSFGQGTTAYSLQLGPYDKQFNVFNGSSTINEQKSAPSLKQVKAIFSSFRFISAKKL